MTRHKSTGLLIKKRLFVEGFRLLQRLAQGELTRREAEHELRIPYREWYRWLKVFEECGIPLVRGRRQRKGRTAETTVRLWRTDWHRLIEKPRGHRRPRGRTRSA